MQFLSRMILALWLLTGFAAAPVLASAMNCHDGMRHAQAVSPHAMHMSTNGADTLHPKTIPDRSRISCAAHCLGACIGFVLATAVNTEFAAPAGAAICRLPVTILSGLSLGPPIEPPISALA
jgi:hypothetical protein